MPRMYWYLVSGRNMVFTDFGDLFSHILPSSLLFLIMDNTALTDLFSSFADFKLFFSIEPWRRQRQRRIVRATAFTTTVVSVVVIICPTKIIFEVADGSTVIVGRRRRWQWRRREWGFLIVPVVAEHERAIVWDLFGLVGIEMHILSLQQKTNDNWWIVRSNDRKRIVGKRVENSDKYGRSVGKKYDYFYILSRQLLADY